MEWTQREGEELQRVREEANRSKRYCASLLKKSGQTWANWEKAETSPDDAEIKIIETEVFPNLGRGYFERFSIGTQSPDISDPDPTKEELDAALSVFQRLIERDKRTRGTNSLTQQTIKKLDKRKPD